MEPWSFTAIGQPVTTNHGYKTGRMPVSRRGVAVLNEDLTQRYINRPILTDEARAWRDTVTIFAKLACPSGWVRQLAPKQQLRVILDFRVAHPVDADGCFKFVLDGLKLGIGYDDKFFLPCARSMESGRKPNDACVIVSVEAI